MSESSSKSRAKEKGFFTLIAEVPHLIVALIRAELELLKSELAAKLKATGIAIGLFAVSLSLVMLTLLLLVFAGVFGLSLVLPLWAAALIVAGATLVLAIVFAAIGAKVLSGAKSPKPDETVDSIREDIRVIRGER